MNRLTLVPWLLCAACSFHTDPIDDDGRMLDDGGMAAEGDGGYPVSDSSADTDAQLVGFGEDAGPDVTDSGLPVDTDAGPVDPGTDAGPDAGPVGTDAGPEPAELGICNPCSRPAQMAGLQAPCRTGLLCAVMLGQTFCFPYCDDNSNTAEPECDSAFGAGNYTCNTTAGACMPKTSSIYAAAECAPYAE